jgi:hypothetical protein
VRTIDLDWTTREHNVKVLLLDTAFAAAPIYSYLIQDGHDVWVMGNRASDLLAKKARTSWIDQDYSQIGDVKKHLLRLGIDYVVPGCTDVSIETSLQLGMNSRVFDTPEANRTLTNKLEFRRLCHELALPAPTVIQKEEFPTLGRFICKPPDSFSGRGMTVFDGTNLDALNAAYDIARKASPSSTALIETFVRGELYSCSAFVESQRITEAFYVREGSSANPFAVDTSYVTNDFPTGLPQALTNNLERLCSALGLKDGLLHTQFILAEEGPFIVEVSRRCPGDLYSLLIEYSTGFPYAAKYASYFIERKPRTRPIELRHVLRHTVSSINQTIFGGLRFNATAKMRAYFPIQSMGQDLLARQGTRAGILFCESETRQQLLEDYELFLSRRAYDIL